MVAEEQIIASVEEHQLDELAIKRAAAMPLPGSLAEILVNGEIIIDDKIKVRRVVAADWKIFQAINSPIIQMLLESQKQESMRDEVKFSEKDEWELCWQLTHSVLEVLFAIGLDDEDDRAEWLETHESLPEKGSREKFRRTATKEIGRSLSVQKAEQIMSAVVKQFLASHETKIDFKSGDSPDIKKK
jgi:hypothetical protein